MGAVLRRMLEELRALDPAQLMRLELQARLGRTVVGNVIPKWIQGTSVL